MYKFSLLFCTYWTTFMVSQPFYLVIMHILSINRSALLYRCFIICPILILWLPLFAAALLLDGLRIHKQCKHKPSGKCEYQAALESSREILELYHMVSLLEIQCDKCSRNSLYIGLSAINIGSPARIIWYGCEHQASLID